MRTVTVTCDRCGRPARDHVSAFWYEPQEKGAHDLTEADLCQACADALRAWLGGEGAAHAEG